MPVIIGLVGKKRSGKNTTAKIIEGLTAFQYESLGDEDTPEVVELSYAKPLYNLCSALTGLSFTALEQAKEADGNVDMLAADVLTQKVCEDLLIKSCIFSYTIREALGLETFVALVKAIASEIIKFRDSTIEHGVKARYLLQYIGTDIFRKHLPSLWPYILANKISVHATDTIYVVTDVRFENEFKLLVDIGSQDIIDVFDGRIVKCNPSITRMWHLVRTEDNLQGLTEADLSASNDTHASEQFDWLPQYHLDYTTVVNSKHMFHFISEISDKLYTAIHVTGGLQRSITSEKEVLPLGSLLTTKGLIALDALKESLYEEARVFVRSLYPTTEE